MRYFCYRLHTLLRSMGCLCCCCRGGDSDSLSPDSDSANNYQSIKDTEDGPGVSVFVTPSVDGESSSKHKHNLSLPPSENESSGNGWTEQQTEHLEHELEKEIAIRKYTGGKRDETSIKRMLSLRDDAETSNETAGTNGNAETEENPRKESHSANLFRLESQGKLSWDESSLEEQAESMQEEIEKITKRISDVTDT